MVMCLVVAGALTLQQLRTQTQFAEPLPSAVEVTTPTPTASAAVPSQTATPSEAAPPSPSSQPAMPAFVPRHMSIPGTPATKQVDADVISLPTQRIWSKWQKRYVDAFGVPDVKTDPRAFELVAWWSDGPKIGERRDGLIPILLGHTSSRKYGVFNDLGKLPAGTTMVVSSQDAKIVATMELIKVVRDIPKGDPNALTKVLESAPMDADAAAITCSGTLVTTPSGAVSHEENTVAFWRVKSFEVRGK